MRLSPRLKNSSPSHGIVERMSKPSVGFIGVGNMGNPMAANLLRASHAMHVHDLDQAKAQNLIALGAQWAPSIADAVRAADVVLCSLPGPVQVEQVLLSGTGVLANLKKGATVIDTSTSDQKLSQRIDARARELGVHYLEAPVTNAIDAAAEGRLSIFVGGDEAVFNQQRAIFDVLATKIFHVGPAGNGAVIKLMTNLLWFVSAAAIGEGLMLGAKAGIPLNTVWEAIKSSAGNSWVAEHDVPSIFAGHYDPSFSLDLCCKDLRLVNEIAQSQGFQLTMGSHARELFEEARARYGGQAAELHVTRLLEERVGLFLRPPHGQAKG